MARLDFRCPATPGIGMLTLVHGDTNTDVLDANLRTHPEAPSGSESLTINCVAATATPTLTATPSPPTQPRMQKLPRLQNLFLTKQGAKFPPATCESGTNVATLNEGINIPITSQDPKGLTGFQQLGAFQFEVRFDAKSVCVSIVPGPDWTAANGAICSTVVAKGVVRFGCVTTGKGHNMNATVPAHPLAVISVRPQPALYSILRPNQGNGVQVQITNQGCQLADEQGHAIPIFSCEGADVTVRYLEGDVSGDCKVDAVDAQTVAFRWGAALGSLLYTPFMDLVPSGQVKGDGLIDIKDLQFVFGRLPSSCANPWPAQPPVNPKA